MFYFYMLLYCLKIIILLYLKNKLETNGVITIQDIGMTIGMNVILYYVMVILMGLSVSDEFNNVYFLDVLTTCMILGVYIKYIEHKNEENVIESYEVNELAEQEACKMNDRQNLNILSKPIVPQMEYPNIQVIYIICLSPYFAVY